MRSVAKDFAHKPLSWDPATHLETTFQLTNLQKPDSLTFYASYLRELYSSMSQSHTSQHWTHLPRCEFIQLAMIGSEPGIRRGDREEEMVRLAQQGRIETILDYKQPIDFDSLFPIPCQIPLVVLPAPPRPRVLLIEGAPGGGKSTFALYFCHKWASQNSSASANFDLVILVYLRDEAIQSATTLAGILPIDSIELSQAIASHIKSTHGRNVLFIFDGWDEFPLHLQDSSIVASIINEPHRISLHQSTVLITSRPVSSGNLLHIADRRVEILGFTQHQIREYIEKALDGNSTHIQKLVQHLEEHPVIEGYCYVPLHVAILVHVFLTMKGALPTTLHELFCNLVLCCIVRELQTHKKEKILSAVSWSSLDDLPDDLKSKLNDLCVLAFEGVMQNKVVFNPKDLHNFHLPANLPSLGLLQGVEGLTLLSKSLSYNFLHLSVQELLAAYHISHMNSSKQVEVFKSMFGGSRFQAVLHYFSGFTKLANPAIQDFISSYSESKLIIGDQLPLLNCFFEAQEPSLCKLVIPQYEKFSTHLSNEWNPVDYLAIGYFATSLLSTSSLDRQLEISKELDHHKLRLLFLELSKQCTNVPSSPVRRLEIKFNETTLTIESAKLIAHLIQKSPFLSKLIMQQCNIDSSAIVYIAKELQNTNCGLTALKIFKHHEVVYTCSEDDCLALQNMCAMNKSLTHLTLSGMSGSSRYIFQGLQHNTTLSKLCLSNTNLKFTQNTFQALTKMLQVNKTLASLDLSYNWTLSGSLPFWVFEGLQHNTTLLHLSLKCTGLVATEDTYQALTKMLQVNKALTHLDLSQNQKFSDSGTYVLFQGLRHNATLVYLNLSSTEITDKGAKYIAQALQSNFSLQELELLKNRITPNGFACIDESLKANTNSRLKITK